MISLVLALRWIFKMKMCGFLSHLTLLAKAAVFFALVNYSTSINAQSTQNINIEKLYTKWLIDSSDKLLQVDNFCWHLKDQIFEGSELSSLGVDSSGAWINMEIPIKKSDSSCKLTSISEGVKISEAENEEIIISFKAPMPFSRFKFKDNKGRVLELLLEGKIQEIENEDFLSFFKDSVFSARMAGIQNQIFQYPFLLAKYELPTLFYGYVALQISLGQSLFDFSSKGVRQGCYELGFAVPIFGGRIPYSESWSGRIRVAYEGTQVNDQKAIGIYPLLASQMIGGGIEIYKRHSENWGNHLNLGYYFSQTNIAQLNKMTGELGVNYSIDTRWRIETGFKFAKQNIQRLEVTLPDRFNEITYFVGIQVKPYLK